MIVCLVSLSREISSVAPEPFLDVFQFSPPRSPPEFLRQNTCFSSPNDQGGVSPPLPIGAQPRRFLCNKPKLSYTRGNLKPYWQYSAKYRNQHIPKAVPPAAQNIYSLPSFIPMSIFGRASPLLNQLFAWRPSARLWPGRGSSWDGLNLMAGERGQISQKRYP